MTNTVQTSRRCPVKPIMLFIGLTAFLPTIGTALAATDPAAEIVSIKGTGEYSPDGEQAWNSAVIDQALYPGNRVRTGSYSRMGLLFSDRTQIRLSHKTVLRIKEVSLPARDEGSTTLFLKKGRAWTQSKRLSRELIMETPSASAAIRGTDWELEVDEQGSSTITVLSGVVEFYNEFGRLTLNKNEQARAETGKAPVKLLVIQPEDRVQWVTAFTIEPLRHIDPPLRAPADRNQQLLQQGFRALDKNDLQSAGDSFGKVTPTNQGEKEQLALGAAALQILSDQITESRLGLETLITDMKLNQPSAYLILSDIHVYSGELASAEDTINMGLKDFPDNARLYSQLARVQLLADQREKSRTSIAKAQGNDPASYEMKLAAGELARIEGDTRAAREAFQSAAEGEPADDRAWYGLGLIDTELEDTKGARSNLNKALELKPGGTGYHGQLGTLETFANNFKVAESAFGKAIEQNSEDYVALTGLGLMELKRGDTGAALDAFLRAGLLEPRYARSHLYTAVAEYQQGNVETALAELVRSSELDNKDPLPHFMKAIIYTDLFRPADAIDEARRALELMPYLKSLNQLANDTRGSANLGQAFSFMGLEQWAQSYAQESYYPLWAGSHLFLADHYSGLFNKNSELFQGFLSDPTAFGASNRFNTLLQSPGNYFSASFRLTESDTVDGNSPYVEANGLDNSVVPIAYYLAFEDFDLEFDFGPYDTHTFTAALGVKPREDIGLFLFGDHSKLDAEFQHDVSLSYLFDTLQTDRVDLGLHYRLAPESQLWFKAGYFDSTDEIYGILGATPAEAEVEVEVAEYAFRHTFRLNNTHELSWGLETADRTTDSQLLQFSWDDFRMVAASLYDYQEDSQDFYISDRISISPSLMVQADLFYQDHEREAEYLDYIEGFGLFYSEERFSYSRLSPRAGLVYRFAPDQLIRLAYQNWVRPTAFSSLGSVATAGIPLDDRMVKAGGELDRVRGQIDWAVNARTFLGAYMDYKEIDNNQFALTPFIINELESLQKLRSRDLGSLHKEDLLEFVSTPDYAEGEITTAGLSLNHMLNREWGLYGQYVYTSSKNTGDGYHGNEIPYLPEHTAALGATWVRPDGWYFATRFVYRTKRYTDEANTSPLKSSWDGALDLYKESKDKRWLFRFSADEILDDNDTTQYTIEASLRL